MNNSKINLLISSLFSLFSLYSFSQNNDLNIGLDAKIVDGGEFLFDGTNEMLHNKWSYWEGPRLKAKLPIKWEVVKDPINEGMVLNTFDSAAIGGAVILFIWRSFASVWSVEISKTHSGRCM